MARQTPQHFPIESTEPEERSITEEITDNQSRGGVGPGTVRRAGYLLVFER